MPAKIMKYEKDRMPTSEIPKADDFEALFISNSALDAIQAHLNRFNPIKIMGMERMEIRHSAILSWLLNPSGTHGLSDRFLKSFLGEALRGKGVKDGISSLAVLQSDLQDIEVRTEWQNIDIFLLDRTTKWAFVIENKFDSVQHKEQLVSNRRRAEKIYGAFKIQGIFLSLWDEEPHDETYATIKYQKVVEVLSGLLELMAQNIPRDVRTFIAHYVDLLKDATEMNDETEEMKKIARQLYLKHRAVLDFIYENASSDFASAVRMFFGNESRDEPKKGEPFSVKLGDNEIEFVFVSLTSTRFCLLPSQWVKLFEVKKSWEGCEKWWMGYPLTMWFELVSTTKKTKEEFKLRLHAEVGPLADRNLRTQIIETIARIDPQRKSMAFRSGATADEVKFSRFFQGNNANIDDMHDPEELFRKMKELLEKFQPQFIDVRNGLATLSAFKRS